VAAPAVESPFKRRPGPTPTPTPATPAPAPIYGAPVRENGTTFGRRGFAWQIDGDGDGEQGQLDDHLVSLLEPTSHAAEQYRAVRLAIETFRHERGTRTVAITSPGRGDGRTITALNLAGALAQAPDARVVLVEADLRHPGVARALGLPSRRRHPARPRGWLRRRRPGQSHAARDAARLHERGRPPARPGPDLQRRRAQHGHDRR